MARGVSGLGLLGLERGYRIPADPEGEPPSSEATSTIMWRVLAELHATPLLWAAFPFHPHDIGNSRSNRAPTMAELDLGRRFLRDLLDLYRVRRVVAVGAVAARSLEAIEVSTVRVRHPSRGGASAFASGLRSVMAV
jgi:uracil-DNA glycosylase